jgi:hypothetical protein
MSLEAGSLGFPSPMRQSPSVPAGWHCCRHIPKFLQAHAHLLDKSLQNQEQPTVVAEHLSDEEEADVDEVGLSALAGQGETITSLCCCGRDACQAGRPPRRGALIWANLDELLAFSLPGASTL